MSFDLGLSGFLGSGAETSSFLSVAERSIASSKNTTGVASTKDLLILAGCCLAKEGASGAWQPASTIGMHNKINMRGFRSSLDILLALLISQAIRLSPL